MQYARLTVNIEATQLQALEAMAERAGLSVSALARTALNRFIQNPVIFLTESHSDSMQNTCETNEVPA